MLNKILFIVLILISTIFGTDYVVSGAGSSQVNGTYTDEGTYGGYAQYHLAGTDWYLRYDNMDAMGWAIVRQWDMPYYYTSAPGSTPPSTGWDSFWGMGMYPVPTVQQSGPQLTYSSETFQESSENDGSIGNSLTITYTMPGTDYFTGGNGTFDAGKYTVSNLPSGLTVVITKVNSLELSIELTGTASNNNNVDDVLNLEIVFNNSAFNDGDAAAVNNSTKSDLFVNFIQVYTVAASGADFITIAAALAACGDGDFINIAAGSYTEEGLVADKEVTLTGAGTSSTIVQANALVNSANNRVFNVTSNVLIQDMTIQNGKTSGGEDGGGIYVNTGGKLSLKNVSLKNNYSAQQGGGISFWGDSLKIINCTLSGNFSPSSGGCIFVPNGYCEITNSTFNMNISSGHGGGIYVQSPTIIAITKCTFTENSSGICSNDGTLYICNSILADNTSYDYAILFGATLYDNGYNVVNIQTIAGGSPANWNFNHNTDILYSHDYSGNAVNFWNKNGIAIGGNLNISVVLADNNTETGTQTLALTSGSFAIDAGTSLQGSHPVAIPSTDQRGANSNGTTDIGAYEWWSDEGALPVELAAFTADINNCRVMLNWSTSTEVNNFGFEVERMSNVKGQTSDGWANIGFVNGNGNSNSPKDYSFGDNKVSTGKYSYRLKQIDNDGNFEYSKSIEVDFNGVKKFELSQNYPNPFNPSTTIRFNLTEAGNVKLTLFNVLGQEIITLVNEFKESGVHTINFDATELNSGMYIYKIEVGTFVQTRKMTLVK